MQSDESSARKRKACLPCIRAKARCSPCEQPTDRCHRCTRLNKPCEFEVVAKKPGPGPKSRSRVRQLEQRVESLIGLISSQNVGASSATTTTDPGIDAAERTAPQLHTQVVTPESTAPADTPQDSGRYWIEPPPFQAYDPVEAGVIDEQHAYHVVEEFKTSFTTSFPFVLVETDAATLRQERPFLFHAILTVGVYDAPQIQCFLAAELRRQLARVIEYSRKSLEILQGLLVYGAWYHAFYHPADQQLAIVAQLCVALVQDLGLSRNTAARDSKWSIATCAISSRPTGSLTEKRAYLGTFFLTVTFAQAWRKRTTLPYTRYMAQCCDAFNNSVISTDQLIRPMLQSSELLSRVNDHFSYDDIDNSDVKGERIIDISVTNFLGELKRIRDTAPMSTKGNTALNLVLCLLDININEISLYSTLWRAPSDLTEKPPSLIRLQALHRTMEASTTYMNTLLTAPQTKLLQLGLGTWAGWFYAVIVVCKLVFLQENERLGHTHVADIPGELDSMIPENVAASMHTGPHTAIDESGWDALSVARDYNVQQLFESFMHKMRFTLPEGAAPWSKPRSNRDALYAIGCIQHMMLHGFTKRIGQLSAKAGASASYSASSGHVWQPPEGMGASAHVPPTGQMALPFAYYMNFDSLNFDSVNVPQASAVPGQQQVGQEMFGDFMWDMVMDDFTMPAL